MEFCFYVCVETELNKDNKLWNGDKLPPFVQESFYHVVESFYHVVVFTDGVSWGDQDFDTC